MIFWHVMPCRLLGSDKRLRVECCRQCYSEFGGRRFLWEAGRTYLPAYTASLILQIVGTLTYWQNAPIRLNMSVRLPTRPSLRAYTSPTPSWRIFVIFDTGDFHENLARKPNPENALLPFHGNNVQTNAPDVLPFLLTFPVLSLCLSFLPLAAPTIGPVCTR
jgi:hypothetical protein